MADTRRSAADAPDAGLAQSTSVKNIFKID